MKITIILNESYPRGMAATNRIHLYAKRFKSAGHDVEIVVPRPTERHHTKPLNHEIKGEFEGIPFRYPLSPVRSDSFIKRRINDFLSYFKTLAYIFGKKGSSDVLLIVDNRLYMIVVYKLFCWLFCCKYVLEISEFPFVFHGDGFLFNIYKKLYVNNVFKLFNGMIVISDSLYTYFQDKVGKRTKLLKVPILTDTSNFKYTEANSGEIVYTGALNQFKDGIMDLLQGYLDFSKTNPHKKLVLMGDLNVSPDKDRVKEFIEANKMQHDVEITGYVAREVMVDRMCNAAVLVIVKPKNKQSEHCFPTKIAEYLSTSKPVLTTNTGSIPQYLTDKKNAFLIAPNSPSEITERLTYIFDNYGEAELVGKAGRQLAEKEFEYTRQVDRIVDFFNQLRSM